MDRKVDARPPALIERIVQRLVPAASREHVLGDLCERYRSPPQYLRDVLRTLPLIIASRLRRTFNAPLMGFLAFVLWYGVFYGNLQRSWLVATLPTMICIAVLALRDVYRGPAPSPPGVPAAPGVPSAPSPARRAAVDLMVAAACVLLAQVALAHSAPQLLLSQWRALRVGLPLGAITLFFIRLQGAGATGGPQPRALSMAELTSEVRRFEAACRRANRIEIGAGWALIACCGLFAWSAATSIATATCALTAAGALFVIWFLRRHVQLAPMPAGLSFSQSLAFYRDSLARKVLHARTLLVWYVLPLAVGPAVFAVATVRKAPSHATAAVKALAAFVVIGALLAGVAARAARGLARRIDELETLTERA